jgi:hypothetical protein
VTPPSVTGPVRANVLVTPVLGGWIHGWDGDVDVTQLSACLHSDGTGCTTLTELYYPPGCSHGAAVIDPAFTGRYLRVADQLLGPDPVLIAPPRTTPYGPDAWPAGPTVAAAVVGRIAPPTGPRTATCGPPPLPVAPQTGVSPPPVPRPAATATISARGQAAVRCRRTCRVTVRARRRGHTVSLRRTLRPGRRVGIALPTTALRYLGSGPIQITVEVDGRRLARRTVTPARTPGAS